MRGFVHCANCGKEFSINGGWGYAYGGLYVCSYKCMRMMQSEDEKSMEPEVKEKVRSLLEEGMSATEVADRLGIKVQAVYDFKMREKKKEIQEVKQDPDKAVKPEKVKEKAIRQDTYEDVIRLLQDMMALLKKICGAER